MQPSRRSWSESRVGRILSFVVITWSIAGAFIVLQEAPAILVDRLAEKGWIPDALLRTSSSPAKTDCRAEVERAKSSPTDPAVASQARVLVWLLGFKIGFAAGIRSASAGSSQPVDVDPLLAQSRELSEAMGIEVPRLPGIQHAATALPEYQAFVETDPQCIAAEIGEKYSARQAALYKFALIAGHVSVYRSSKIGPLFVPELREYGKQAEVPDELWKPLAAESIDSLPGADTRDKISLVLNHIQNYLKTNP
jgi:hypothetical protein